MPIIAIDCMISDMILKIVQVGDECLRKSSAKLTKTQIKSEKIQNLIDLMIATLRDKPGVGLAAPQVGELLQIIVIEDKKQYHKSVADELLKAQKRKPVALKVIINPVLTIIDNEQQLYFEGCLSVDGFRAVVPRALKVRVTGLDRQGQPITINGEGWLARILQHEVEHLSGNLYVDSMTSRSFMTTENFTKKWSDALPDKIDQSFKSLQ